MKQPTLHVFNISHYCEKARWALDYGNIDYKLNVLSPISHLNNAKRVGLDRGSLPILETSQVVIQGSDKILDWVEEHHHSEPLLAKQSEDMHSLEQELDSVLGVNVRKWYYSEAIIEHPKSVLKIFTHELPLLERMSLKLAWPKVRSVMIKKMDLGAEQGEEARLLVDQQLSVLDNLVEDKNHAFGDQLGRTELTAASLLAPLVLPETHPMSGKISLPPRIQEQMQSWQHRPSMQWVVDCYAAFRC